MLQAPAAGWSTLTELFFERRVVDGDVDLGDLEAGQVLDAPDHVLPHRFWDLVNGPAVADVHRQVQGGLCLVDVNGDAADPARR
jgi:predicted lipid carrier protein YhbT